MCLYDVFAVCSGVCQFFLMYVFFSKQMTAYTMLISDWSSVVCSSDLYLRRRSLRRCTRSGRGLGRRRMRRFSLIGRLGPDDKSKIKLVQSDSDVFEIDFLDGDLRMGFGIGHALDQLASLGLQPSEKGIDLVVLAALVNAGDTRVSRKLNAQAGRSEEHTSELHH